MYLVTFNEFKQFLKDENIAEEPTPILQTPCIVFFNRGEIVKAKVEVANKSAYRWNEKYGLISFQKSDNKYWIRGKEWAKE